MTLGLLVLLFVVVSSSVLEENQSTEYALCRRCGADAVDSRWVYPADSPAAVGSRKVRLFDSPRRLRVQTLVNPLGLRFEVFVAGAASCDTSGEWTSGHSWFPGYDWKFCSCSRCEDHLGWAFEPTATAEPNRDRPSRRGFYLLTLDKVVGEKYADSLLIQQC